MKNTTNNTCIALRLQAENIRKRVIEIIYAAKAGHTGGSLSSIELQTVLFFAVLNIDPYNPGKAGRDRYILSKGHSIEALYATLEARGFLSRQITDSYGQYLSPLSGHPTKKVPGVELNSGALGHGLSVGAGMSIAHKMDGASAKTFVLMGDGEQGEGSIYEAAMAASYYRLDNLVAIIDRNQLQISGRTEDVMAIEPLRQRWEAFGWEVFEADGHCMEALLAVFRQMDYGNQKPKLLIAHTRKGNGVSYMENVVRWHHGVPDKEQYQQALREIDARIAQISLNT
ncbi:MAG: transketolase [Dysgonamonadaceae bacterium]|nr:transketolase [Dysgonamonadaceae bacterium]